MPGDGCRAAFFIDPSASKAAPMERVSGSVTCPAIVSSYVFLKWTITHGHVASVFQREQWVFLMGEM